MANKTLVIPGTEAADVANNWQTAFVLKSDLRQKDVYSFESELRRLEQTAPNLETVLSKAFQIMRALGMNINSNIETEQQLKAAIKADWIETPQCEIATISPNGTGKARTVYLFGSENVDEMHPGRVRWYGQRVNEHYNHATEIPDPNS